MIIGGMVLLWRFNPSDFAFYPRCPFYTLTGYKCPGCGTLRALHLVFNGNLKEAIAMNPILAVFVPMLIVLIMRPKLARNRHVGYLVASMIFLYWITRNLVR
ncbi:MAG: DUF2752 domain-containing protein [Kiritimatiellae bacterium]|nr:DUF2752 domain-containing protein [Kiritimatiellia bacterium]